MISNYYKYYEEIKNRLILIVICWLFCFSMCYTNKEVLLFLIAESNKSLTTIEQTNYFIFTNITEVLNVYIELTFFISNQILIIALIYQIFMFISLGLYHFEFNRLKMALQLFLATWIISSILLYVIIVPFSWNFFLSFHETLGYKNQLPLFFEARLSEYLTYFINLYYLSLLNCQFLALIIFILTSLSNQPNKIKNLRRLFYIVFIVFSTIITPPDIISQLIISCSLVSLYELFLIVKIVKTSMATN